MCSFYWITVNYQWAHNWFGAFTLTILCLVLHLFSIWWFVIYYVIVNIWRGVTLTDKALLDQFITCIRSETSCLPVRLSITALQPAYCIISVNLKSLEFCMVCFHILFCGIYLFFNGTPLVNISVWSRTLWMEKFRGRRKESETKETRQET